MILTPAQWIALLPILIVSATIVVVMLAIAFRRHHWWNATLSVVGLNLAFIACCTIFFGPMLLPQLVPQILPQQVTPLLVVDSYGQFYVSILIATTLACATLAHAYMEGYAGHKEELYLLLLLSALGAMVLVCSNHLASFFIGLELLSVPLYAMVAYQLNNPRSLEAGIKYLLLSAMASAFLLFGMALLYAQTGALDFAGLARGLAQAEQGNLYFLAGGALILVAVGFKLSVVPFHLWTPDVFEGAPAPVAAFLATASKTAVFAVLLRFFVQADGHQQPALLNVLTILAIASMLIGNVLALLQDNIKRLLAYSSIAHFGYCLVALIAAGPWAVEAVGVYLLTYVVTTLGAFGVVTLASTAGEDSEADLRDDYSGLFWRRPYLASILTAMMLSLAGIPVTAGFIGKFYVVLAGVDAREWWLVAAVVLGSAIGLYYYLRVVITLFAVEPGVHRRRDAALNWGQQMGGAMVLVLMLFMLVMGLYPQPLLYLVQQAPLLGH
ncbi:MAG: NADH-quinone oxidoreductase subunit NuoN [Nevskiales bacterium]